MRRDVFSAGRTHDGIRRDDGDRVSAPRRGGGLSWPLPEGRDEGPEMGRLSDRVPPNL